MPFEFDAVLKQLFTQSARGLLRTLAGAPVAELLDTELPRVNAPRMDLLARLADGTLFNLEFQTKNETDFVYRAAVYYLETYRPWREHPRQAVFYVGREKLCMADGIDTATLRYRLRLVDISDLDGDTLADSDDLGDAILATLARVQDRRAAARRVLARIATLEGGARRTATEQLLILAGLRDLELLILEEARHTMPFDIDLMENRVVRGYHGRGREEGQARDAAEVLRTQLSRRFGQLPDWAEARLTGCHACAISGLERGRARRRLSSGGDWPTLSRNGTAAERSAAGLPWSIHETNARTRAAA